MTENEVKREKEIVGQRGEELMARRGRKRGC